MHKFIWRGQDTWKKSKLALPVHLIDITERTGDDNDCDRQIYEGNEKGGSCFEAEFKHMVNHGQAENRPKKQKRVVEIK